MNFIATEAPRGSVVLLERLGGVAQFRILRWSENGRYVQLGKVTEGLSGDEPWYPADNFDLIEVLSAKESA